MMQLSSVALFFWIAAAVPDATDKPQETLSQNIAEIRVSGTIAKGSSAQLVVQNSASFTVHLESCVGENYTLPAGGSASLPATGVLGFWVVPDTMEFNCSNGPFGFYVGATLTDSEQVIGVSFGVDEPELEAEPGDKSAEKPASEEAREEKRTRTDDQAIDDTWLASLELKAQTDNGTVSVRCGGDKCSESHEVVSLPTTIALHIAGPQRVGLRSSFYGHYGGYGYHRYGYHYHGPYHRYGWHHHYHHGYGYGHGYYR